MLRLLSTLLLGAALIQGLARAAPPPEAVLTALSEDGGWALHAQSGEVTVYQKHIPLLDMTAYKGVTVVDVDRELLFSIICDTAGHQDFSPSLADSRVLSQTGDRFHYYQVARAPALMPISDRYWFNQAHIRRDVSMPGHHVRTWAPVEPQLYPEALANVQARFPDAVFVEVTYGSWEVIPTPDGRTQLIYRSLTHPGGNVPGSVFEALAARSLPDNMQTFVNEARARAGG